MHPEGGCRIRFSLRIGHRFPKHHSTMTSRRLFLTKLVGLVGLPLLAKASSSQPLSLPVVLPRAQSERAMDGISLDFTTVDYERLLHCISAVETGHRDWVIGPKGERSRFQMKRSVWEQHWGNRRPFSRCKGEAAEGTAHDHLCWLEPQLDAGAMDRVWPLAWCWRGGIGAWLDPHVSISGQQHRKYCDYADRVTALYNDSTYKQS